MKETLPMVEFASTKKQKKNDLDRGRFAKFWFSSQILGLLEKQARFRPSIDDIQSSFIAHLTIVLENRIALVR